MTNDTAFDWSRVRWDDAKAPQCDDCSYCGAAIDDDAVPLRMWNQRGSSCVFCTRCDAAALRAVMEVQKALDRLDRGSGVWVQPSKDKRRPSIEETRRLLIRPASGKPRLH